MNRAEPVRLPRGIPRKYNRDLKVRNTERDNLMNADSLLGVWTGVAHNSNGWDMKITVSVIQPFKIGSMLGTFDIPMIPCSGVFRVVAIRGETLELAAQNLQGDCRAADFDSLELLPEGTLLYISRGRNWETRGVLQRTMREVYIEDRS